MILKILGISVLVYICIKTSYDKKTEMKNKFKYTEGIINALSYLRKEIMFFSSLLGKALINSSEFAGIAEDLFASSGEKLIENPSEDLGEILVDNLKFNDTELVSVIRELGLQLGTADSESEAAIIDAFIEKLSELKCKYKDEYENKGKLIEKVGIITGIFVAILIL